MAINIEALRAAVAEKNINEPAPTEEDLEAEKAQLREDIRRHVESEAIEERTADGLVSLNHIKYQNNVDRLEELEKKGLSAMLTRSQQEQKVADEVNAAVLRRHSGETPKNEGGEN